MSERTSSAQPIRVLIVEDDADDVLILREDLEAAPVPFEAEVVSTLAAALQRLNDGGIDVVVTDLSLPDSSGLATFHALEAHPLQRPVIVLSGLADESLAVETVEEGAQDYLIKGQYDSRMLVRAVRYAIKRAESDRALAAERNLLRSVIDNLMDAIYVKDVEGRYLLGNLAHAKQLGFPSPDSVIGKKTADLFSPETTHAFLEDDTQVMRKGEPIVNRHERVMSEDGTTARWLSTTKVPLRGPEGEIVGLVGIGRDITARKVAEEKLARYTRELQAKNAELEEDLEMAREVQLAFLPQQFPTFPRHAEPAASALQFHAEYLPTTTLGGDFFHVIPISDHQAGVLICDVMGHGVRAALVTAVHRALVEELTPFAHDPGDFLSQMNHELYSILRRTRSPMFASAFYLTVNTATGELQYANAGHPRPLHIRRAQDQVSMLDAAPRRPGPALGLFPSTKYITQNDRVGTGDVLLLFTDGLYEVEDTHGELYDQELLLETVNRQRALPTRELFREILDEARSFSATGQFLDDVCLVALEVCRLADRDSEGADGPLTHLQRT